MKRPVLRRRPDDTARPSGRRPSQTRRPARRVRCASSSASDRDAFLALVHESRDLHRPWAYPPERADQFDEL